MPTSELVGPENRPKVKTLFGGDDSRAKSQEDVVHEIYNDHRHVLIPVVISTISNTGSQSTHLHFAVCVTLVECVSGNFKGIKERLNPPLVPNTLPPENCIPR